jgi:hypothetical protein
LAAAVVESLEPLTVPERKLPELNYVHVHATAWTLADLLSPSWVCRTVQSDPLTLRWPPLTARTNCRVSSLLVVVYSPVMTQKQP